MDSEDHHFIKSLEQEWTCPISKAQMHDPVITSDGQTYQREAIAHWFLTNSKSPNTNLPLENTSLIPNIAFKNLAEKLYAELPVYLSREEALKTEISQLKEQIAELSEELEHEKQKNDELLEKQEKYFKTKKVQKQRHEQKNGKLRIIREQKNSYQKQLQQLTSKEQQQARQIRLLKEELANLSARFEKASAGEREFSEKYKKVHRNRHLILHKLEFSFASNFTFIGHLLQSIEDAKKIELEEQQKEKGTQQTIFNEDATSQQDKILQNTNKGMIQRLEEIIRNKVNGEYDEINEERLLFGAPPVRRFVVRRFPPLGFRRGGPNMSLSMQSFIHMQNNNGGNIVQPVQNNAQPIPSQESEQPIVSQQQEIDPSRIEQIAQEILPQKQRDNELYRQLLSIKWMMSKRNYKEIPEFYNYQVCRNNEDPETYWFGVRISILESHIPFNEFLPYSWNHVRWLDLSSCNVDDALWQTFIQNSHNFRSLMFINAYRNKIETIRKTDLERFPCLIKFIVKRNKLTPESILQIENYMKEHPKVKIEFANDPDIMEQQPVGAGMFEIQ